LTPMSLWGDLWGVFAQSTKFMMSAFAAPISPVTQGIVSPGDYS